MNNAYLACALVVVVGAGCGDSSTGATGGGGTGSVTSATHGSTTSTNSSMTTTGNSMTTGSLSATASSSSGGPPMCPTMSYSNISGDCDLLQQTCTGNFTCGVFDDGSGGSTTKCQVTAGLKPTGAACADDVGATSECEKGDFCIANVCTKICCPETMDPCGSGKCNLKVTFTGTMDFINVCTYAPACTLFTANACMGMTQCHPEERGLATCQANSGANVVEGGMCQAVNDCGDMQLCVGAMAPDLFCRYACTMGSSAAPGMGGCPANQTCQGLQDFTSIGVCIPN
jgi:hypothetical protein